MNKQLVLAALFATAHGQTTCEDANVASAKAAKAALDTRKAALDTAKTSLAALAKTEAAAYAKAKGRYDTQDTLMAPFRTALSTATTNHKTQNDAQLAATGKIAALVAPMKAKADDLKTASDAVGAQDKLIATAKANCDKFDASVKEHTTEAATLKTDMEAKTKTYDQLVKDETATKKTWEAAQTAQTTPTTGTTAKYNAAGITTAAAKKAEATKTGGAADTAFDIELAKWNTYKVAKQNYDEQVKLSEDLKTACASDCTLADDPIKALKVASDAKRGAAGTGFYKVKEESKTAWEGALKTLTAAQKAKLEAVQAEAALKKVNEDQTKVVGDTKLAYDAKTKAKNAAEALKKTADAADVAVKKQLAQSKLNQTRGNDVMSALSTALTPLRDAVVIATHMKKIEDDKNVAQVAAKAAGNLNLADLVALKGDAQAVVDRAKLKLDFYKGIMDTAKTSNDAAAGNVTANGTAITKCGTDTTAAEAATAVAVAACKGRGYREAQTAMKALEDKNTADTKAATDLIAAYKHDAPTDGTAGTRCEFPAKAGSARPVCKEGLCCGAAQKFLRDGTKLAVESCQATTTVAYTYWPSLAKGQTMAPASQAWRFSCISGAQKLAATAAAALAAGYMMA